MGVDLMNEAIVEEVLTNNFDSLKTTDEVIFFIGYLAATYSSKIPTTVIEDIHSRLQDCPNNVNYAKQQLSYLVRWITR